MGALEDDEQRRLDLLERFETAARRQGDAFGERALVALVPWLAFWVAAKSADRWIEFRDMGVAPNLGAVVLTLVLVFLPALAAVCAAPRGVARHVVTVLVSGVAIYAGVTSIAQDDGQAGFVLFLVPMLVLPLAGMVAIGSVFAATHTIRRDAQ